MKNNNTNVDTKVRNYAKVGEFLKYMRTKLRTERFIRDGVGRLYEVDFKSGVLKSKKIYEVDEYSVERS